MHQPARFEHLERGEAVQEGKGCLAAIVVDRLCARLARLLGADMLDGLDDLATDKLLPVVEVGPRLGQDPAVGQDVEGPLQLGGELGLQKTAGVLGRALKVVACRLVHRCGSCLSFGLTHEP